MANPIRYAILDHAGDDAALWELSWSLTQQIDGQMIEVHPRRTVAEVLPELLDLLREGHVEIYSYADPQGPPLSLADAVVVASDQSNWDPATAKLQCGIVTTESGDREYEIEYAAAHGS